MNQKERFEELFKGFTQSKINAFRDWKNENAHVYEEFERYADQMRRSGRERYSAEIIVNKIRWERDLVTTGDPFKINNNYKSMLARLLIYKRPEFDGFFELRSKQEGVL